MIHRQISRKNNHVNDHVNVHVIPGLFEVLGTPPDPFVGIDTDYLYEKFCREHLGFLVSNIAIACYNSIMMLLDF